MTKYWPTSIMLRSQELRPEQKLELKNHELGMSESTLVACHNLACRLPACTSMAVICSENAPMRRVYLRHPSDADWLALERSGFVMAFNNFGFVMDALH